MAIGVEMTGGYDEFGKSTAVRTLLVWTGKYNVFADIFLATPIPNALKNRDLNKRCCEIMRVTSYLDAEYVATISWRVD